MLINHTKLGNCFIINHFIGKNNQLVLIKNDKEEKNTKVKDSRKTNYWILWGPKDLHINNLSYSHFNRKGMYFAKAIKMFINLSKDVDKLDMHPIKKD